MRNRSVRQTETSGVTFNNDIVNNIYISYYYTYNKLYFPSRHLSNCG